MQQLSLWQQQQSTAAAAAGPGRRRSSSSNAPRALQAAAGLPTSARGRQRCLVTCMAHPRRVAKVASQIQREISEMFIYDKVVQEAICPERRSGLDDALSAVASITDVYVSGDLQVVKVYVSVYSDEQGKERAIANLKRIAPYVRSRIGQAVRLRLTPEIRFVQDNSLDDLEQIQAAIGQEDFDRYVAEGEAEAAGGASSSSGASASSSSRAAAAAGGGDEGEETEEEDDDGGFFDLPGGTDADEGGGEQQQQQRRVAWSRQDPATFFAVDEDELQEAEQSSSLWYARPGPFDELFAAGGQQLVEERRQGAKVVVKAGVAAGKEVEAAVRSDVSRRRLC